MSTPFVVPLYEGTFSVGLDRKFNRIDRHDPPAKGALKLAINPFLIRLEEHTILLDAGLGDFGEDTSTATLIENLAHQNLAEHDITDIFASHLHYDHLGGLVNSADGYLSLTFPDARLWVNRNEWNKLIESDQSDEETKLDFIHFLNAQADLHFLDPEDQPIPGVKVREVGGHTEFSQVLFIEQGEHKYMMAGDVIGEKGAVKRRYAAKYDMDPEKTMKIREELKEMAYKKEYTILAYHESQSPIFRLTGEGSAGAYSTESVFSFSDEETL